MLNDRIVDGSEEDIEHINADDHILDAATPDTSAETPDENTKTRRNTANASRPVKDIFIHHSLRIEQQVLKPELVLQSVQGKFNISGKTTVKYSVFNSNNEVVYYIYYYVNDAAKKPTYALSCSFATKDKIYELPAVVAVVQNAKTDAIAIIFDTVSELVITALRFTEHTYRMQIQNHITKVTGDYITSNRDILYSGVFLPSILDVNKYKKFTPLIAIRILPRSDDVTNSADIISACVFNNTPASCCRINLDELILGKGQITVYTANVLPNDRFVIIDDEDIKLIYDVNQSLYYLQNGVETDVNPYVSIDQSFVTQYS